MRHDVCEGGSRFGPDRQVAIRVFLELTIGQEDLQELVHIRRSFLGLESRGIRMGARHCDSRLNAPTVPTVVLPCEKPIGKLFGFSSSLVDQCLLTNTDRLVNKEEVAVLVPRVVVQGNVTAVVLDPARS